MEVTLAMFKGDGTRRDFPLDKSKVIVGRINTCDLRIPLTSVSRQHCEITLNGEQVRIRDLGSSNGTFLNDRRINEGIVRPGDAVRIGPVVFFLVVDGVPDELEPIRSVIDQSGGTGVSVAQGTMAAMEPGSDDLPPEDTLGGQGGHRGHGGDSQQAPTLPMAGDQDDELLPLAEDAPPAQAKAPNKKAGKAERVRDADSDDEALSLAGEEDDLPVLGEDVGEDEDVVDAEALEVLDDGDDLESLDAEEAVDELDVMADSGETLEMLDDEFELDQAQSSTPEDDDPIAALEAMSEDDEEARLSKEARQQEEDERVQRRRKSG